MDDEIKALRIVQTADIVATFVANNSVPLAGLPDLITSVHGVLVSLGQAVEKAAPVVDFEPAVTVRKSLASREHILSMIDGKPYVSLKRHLSLRGVTPAEYRTRYKLPIDYPMIAPAYSERRSAMAKAIGLGRKPGQSPAAKVAAISAPAKPVKAAWESKAARAPAKAAPKPRVKKTTP
jgi:predicted transcriptional regulator